MRNSPNLKESGWESTGWFIFRCFFDQWKTIHVQKPQNMNSRSLFRCDPSSPTGCQRRQRASSNGAMEQWGDGAGKYCTVNISVNVPERNRGKQRSVEYK
jgi:hypothetical protein